MELHTPTSLSAFADAVEPFLLRHESQHGLLLGVARRAKVLERDGFCGFVTDGGEVVAAALRTSDRLILSRTDRPDAVALLAQATASHTAMRATLGPSASMAAFTAACNPPGRSWGREMGQGVYELRAVSAPAVVPGARRLARRTDRNRLIDWIMAFHIDSLGEPIPRDRAERGVDDKTRASEMHVWEVELDGETRIVSCAAAVDPTMHGIRVNSVYTPPEQRGHGYASALVASLSQHLLDGGRDMVFLHTDLANPTSNRIYQRIGYRRVGEMVMRWLEEPVSR